MSAGASSTVPTTLTQQALFGRKYQVKVSLPSADGSSQDVLVVTDSAFQPEALRATFDIYTPAIEAAFWYADICIYNLDQPTTQAILQRPIKQGMSVTVAAGYQNGNYGVIWSGPVFQPFLERENVTDLKRTLHCILGLDELSRTAISGTYAAGTTQFDIINQIANQLFTKNSKARISSNLKPGKFPRGGVFFGNPHKYFADIAADNNMQYWLNPSGLTLGRADEDTPISTVDFVYSPATGIIGVPQQTQYGVNFKVLLDPRLQIVHPLPVVKIDNSSIRILKRQIGELIGVLDQDGEYIVVAARHYGDTRGEPWYTEISGVTSVGGKMAMMQAFAGGNLNSNTNY